MKHKAPALEFSFATEAFNLEIQTTQDGQRLTQEADASREARAAAERQQLHIQPGQAPAEPRQP